jgi:hypothetical protein
LATRAQRNRLLGTPQNLGEPINSAANDFCPTPVGKRGLFFVSRQALHGACGQGDIYYTHRNGAGAWAEPERLLSSPGRAEQRARRARPSWVDVSGKPRGKKQLFFSRSSTARTSPARST